MSISIEAAEARDSLSDDKELISTYEVVTFSWLDCYCKCQKLFYLSSCVKWNIEVNCTGWKTKVCISCCVISWRRDWSAEVRKLTCIYHVEESCFDWHSSHYWTVFFFINNLYNYWLVTNWQSSYYHVIHLIHIFKTLLFKNSMKWFIWCID